MRFSWSYLAVKLVLFRWPQIPHDWTEFETSGKWQLFLWSPPNHRRISKKAVTVWSTVWMRKPLTFSVSKSLCKNRRNVNLSLPKKINIMWLEDTFLGRLSEVDRIEKCNYSVPNKMYAFIISNIDDVSIELQIYKQMPCWRTEKDNSLNFTAAHLMMTFSSWRNLPLALCGCFEKLLPANIFKNKECKVSSPNEVDWWVFESNCLGWLQQFQTKHWLQRDS